MRSGGEHHEHRRGDDRVRALENFGTWQTGEGRLAWGVDDFDESECRPTPSTWPGWPRAPRWRSPQAGSPSTRLAQLVHHATVPCGTFWTALTADPVDDLPHSATAALRRVRPTPDWRYRAHRRFAGLGSRGHRRYVAVGPVPAGDGRPVDTECREVKEMSPPAGRWLGRPRSTRASDTPMVRAPDPWQARRGHWSARRPAPDCIELDLRQVAVEDRGIPLFGWMGRETANVHLGTHDRRDAVLRDLEQRPSGWLSDAAGTLVDAVTHDQRRWSDHHDRHHRPATRHDGEH